MYKRQDHDGSQSSQTFDRPRDLFIGGGLCGLMLFISTSLQQVGIQYTTVGKAGFITALYIILVPLSLIHISSLEENFSLSISSTSLFFYPGFFLLRLKYCITMSDKTPQFY